MAKVRARKETNNLYLDFSYLGYRCREQTALPDTPQNRKKVEAVLKRVEAQIILDQFDYEKEFPGSKNLKRIKERELQNKVNDLPFNCFSNEVHQTFSEFAETWFLESEVQWRSSHTKNVRGIIDSSLKPAFGSKPIDQISKAEILQFRAMLARKPGRNCNGLKKPIIAAVDGIAIGVGTSMLLHCDLVYCNASAVFQLPFTRLGVAPEGGTSLLLPQSLGHRAAFEILALGQPFDASRALELGIVNTVVSQESALGKAMEVAEELLTLPPNALLKCKALLKAPVQSVLQQTIDQEMQYFGEMLQGKESLEAITAVMEKRVPDFVNC